MANGPSIAKAYVQIIPSAQGIQGSLTNLLGGEADVAGKNAGGKFSAAMGGALKYGSIALAAAGASMLAFGKDAVQAGMSFDSSMSQVAATMGTTVDQIGELRELSLEMGSTTAFSASEAADALNYMALAGYDADTSMTMLPNVLNLAAAGGMDLALASDMITDSQSALGLSLEETSVLVDQMAQAASKSNTSVSQLGEAILTVGGTASYMYGGTEELATVLGVLADNGIKGSEGGTHLRNMLLSLSAPTDKAQATLKQLGVEIFDAEGNMRSFAEIFPELNAAMAGMTDQQKLDAFSTIFNSRDIASATALLNTSTERWEELGGAIADAGGAAQQMADTQLDNLAGDITIFKSALEGTEIAISDGLTPSLREFVQFGTEGLSSLTEAINGGGGLTAAAESIGTFLAEGITKVVSALPSILEAGGALLTGLLQGFQANIPQIADGAVQAVAALVGFLIQNLPLILDTGMQMIPALINGIANALPELIAYLPELVLAIGQTIMDNFPLIIDAGINLLAALLQGIVSTVPQLIAYTPVIISNLFQALIRGVATLMGAGVRLAQGVLNGIKSLVSSFGTIGRNIVQGIWSGISGSLSWIKSMITGWVGNVKNFLKSLFGINSPSTWARDMLGVNIARGIGVGFEDEMVAVERSMEGAMPDLSGSVQFEARTAPVRAAVFSDNAERGGFSAESESAILAELRATREAIQNMGIYLDDGTLVGRVNQGLGMIRAGETRRKL